MPEYAGICVNMPKSAYQLFLHVSIVIPCVLKPAVTYFKYMQKKQKDVKSVSCD